MKGAEVTIAVAAADAVSAFVSDVIWTVTVPWPTLASTWSSIAPVDRPGRIKVGIDCVGEPSRPMRVAVTGPLVPVIVALYESSVLPVLRIIRRKVIVPG
jgi:hypothetical protein